MVVRERLVEPPIWESFALVAVTPGARLVDVTESIEIDCPLSGVGCAAGASSCLDGAGMSDVEEEGRLEEADEEDLGVVAAALLELTKLALDVD
jgi:hypothetical protein